ncbi:putative membrane protein YagU involved in acid resistance [Nocardiopsis mwathae]|uniref:Putative membrane protein YagU involved in acid resistance n=1 Tax=Nocardiopsis mwathae TaxID=1472723 RepID=A0A7X0D8J9_9ACTN|nr:hypothetical protein [Nocardiopsis mwathae]MBB6174816.1 putative membrane protein YagU involved in acid resistance [Nocardiopsis mwathae]
MSTIAHARSHAVTHAWRGVLAGIGGGIVFGVLMAMTGMLESVAMLVGADDAIIGGVVHLIIAAAFGLVFGLVMGAYSDKVWTLLGAGVVYGLVLWVVGGLMIMPAWLGMEMFVFDQMAWMSLAGHLLFGIVLAGTMFALSKGDA